LAATLGDRIFIPLRSSDLSWRLCGFEACAGSTLKSNMIDA
jgi:hypothetical protein